MLAGASTALGSLAATAGGGEAALWPGLAPRLPEVFDAGGGRWANRGTGADLPLAAALLHLLQLKLRLNSIDGSCIEDSGNNLKNHMSAKHHIGQLQQGCQSLSVGEASTGDGARSIPRMALLKNPLLKKFNSQSFDW